MRSPAARSVLRILAIVLCAGGIWISHHLALKHVKASAPPAAQAAAAAPQEEKSLLDEACSAIIETADCDEVMASPWGEMTLAGVRFPTALLGLYYFSALLVWFVLIGPVTASRAWVHVGLAGFMAVGLGVSVLLMYQMSKLPVPCDLCIVTHALNLLLFVCVLLLWPRKPLGGSGPVVVKPAAAAGSGLFAPLPDAPAPAGKWPHWWMLAVTPVVILLVMWVETLSLAAHHRGDPRALQQLRGKLGDAESKLELVAREREMYRRMSEQHEVSAEVEEFRTKLGQEIEQLEGKIKVAEQARDYYKKQFDRYNTKWQHTFTAWQLNPPVKFSEENLRVRGPASARHTLTVFSDFQCPTCKVFETNLNERIVPMAERHGGLRVIFKQWPISTGCNPHAIRDLHPAACAAALAAEAAMMVGGNDAFWKMHDLLFARQDEWKQSLSFDGYARQIGLDVEAFQAAMRSDEAMRRVKADVEEGVALGKELVDGGLSEAERDFLKVDSTPSIYINNKKLSTAHHIMTWQAILAQPPAAATPAAAAGPAR